MLETYFTIIFFIFCGWECFRRMGGVPMWLKGLIFEGEIVRNLSVSLNHTH